MALGVLLAVSSVRGWTGRLQAAEGGTGDGRDLRLFHVWLYSVYLEQLIQNMATSGDVGSLLFAASRFPLLLGKASLLERKSKGHNVRGKQDIAAGPGLILGCKELSKKRCLGGCLRSKEDGSCMKTPEVWNLPVSHDTACGSHNVTGDAEVLV